MFWIIQNDIEQGPYTLEQLGEIGLTADTPVWREGLPDWLPAARVEELAGMIPPAVPVPEPEPVAYCQPPVIGGTNTVQGEKLPVPETAVAAIYAPANAIPAGYVAIAPAEAKCPPTYLAWAIVSTILFFLPLGVCAIICAVKTSGHFRAGRIEKAARMSERAALFIILSLVAWLIWMPFSVVFAII